MPFYPKTVRGDRKEDRGPGRERAKPGPEAPLPSAHTDTEGGAREDDVPIDEHYSGLEPRPERWRRPHRSEKRNPDLAPCAERMRRHGDGRNWGPVIIYDVKGPAEICTRLGEGEGHRMPRRLLKF